MTDFQPAPAPRTLLVGLGEVGRLSVALVRAERLSRLPSGALGPPLPGSLLSSQTALLLVAEVEAHEELRRLLREARRSVGLTVVVLSAGSDEGLAGFFGSPAGRRLGRLADVLVPVRTPFAVPTAQLLAVLLEQGRVRERLGGRGLCPVVVSSTRSLPALPKSVDEVLWVACRTASFTEAEKEALRRAFRGAAPASARSSVRIVRRGGAEVTGGLVLPHTGSVPPGFSSAPVLDDGVRAVRSFLA